MPGRLALKRIDASDGRSYAELGNDGSFRSSIVAEEVRKFLNDYPAGWQGTATWLLEELSKKAKESVSRQKAWPKSAASLSNKLRRLAPNLGN